MRFGRHFLNVAVFCLFLAGVAGCNRQESGKPVPEEKPAPDPAATTVPPVAPPAIVTNPVPAGTNTEAIQTNKPAEARVGAEAEPRRVEYPAQELVVEAIGLLKDSDQTEDRHTEAIEQLREAAGKGNPAAEHALAVCYIEGFRVERDAEQALKWLRASAEHGFAEAQFKLASVYAQGTLVQRDESAAAEWVRKAAEQGHPEAEYNLGTLYITGRGVEADKKAAAKWFKKAAEHGHPTAQSNMGVLYAEGTVVEKDYEEALKWFQKAAHMGQPTAQYNLGMALADGKFVEQDKVEAYKWFTLAAEQNDEDASRARDFVALEMTPGQIAEALKKAREFRAELRARWVAAAAKMENEFNTPE